jgi:predicted AAA+ superfamily ATPase
MNHIYFERENDTNITQAFKNWRIVLLLGARQIGKTTTADAYFNTITIPKKKILGQNADIQKSLGSCSLSIIRTIFGDAKFIFIDEAQYIPEIGTVLKLIYDSMPGIQILATGSSAFGLATKTSESLAGRKISLPAFPLTVREVLQNTIFDDISFAVPSLLLHGMYPRVLSTPETNHKEEILIELADAYLYKDVLEFQGIRKAPMVAKLAQMLALQIGNQVSLSELAKSLEIHKATVQNYIDVLIKSFVIFPVASLSRNPRKELHKSIKYYFYDSGVRNAIIRNFSPLELRNDVGQLWENFVMSEMYKRYAYDKKPFTMYHWRTYEQKEIDMVLEENGILHAYECKFSGDERDINRATIHAWEREYPTIKIDVINKYNFVSFLK